MLASFGYFRQTMQYITSLEASCSSQGYVSFQCPLNSLYLFFSKFFSVVLSVFSSLGRVLSGRPLDGSLFRGWLLRGVAVERLLFTKDSSSQFPNLGSVELPIGSWQGFLGTEPQKKSLIMFLLGFFFTSSL